MTDYKALTERLKPEQQAILVAGSGRYSFKGSGYVRGGIFDRIELVQGDNIIRFHDRDQQRIGDLHAERRAAPSRDRFIHDPGGNAIRSRRAVAVGAAGAARHRRPRQGVPHLRPELCAPGQIPDHCSRQRPPADARRHRPPPRRRQPLTQPVATEQPLWQRAWRAKAGKIVVLLVALAVLTAIFFFQDCAGAPAGALHRLRLGFLVFTLFWLGWYAEAQLSVVNILAFFNALRTDFRWEILPDGPADLHPLVRGGRRDAVLGPRCVLRLALPVRRLAGIAEPPSRRRCMSPSSACRSACISGFGRSNTSYSSACSVYLSTILSLSEEAAEIEPFKTAIVLRFMRELAVRAICGRRCCPRGCSSNGFTAAIFVRLAPRLAIPGADAHVRLVAPLSGVRQSLPALRQRVPGAGDPSGRSHQSQRVHPVPALPGTLSHDDHRCPVMIQRRLKSERRVGGHAAKPAAAPVAHRRG